MGWGKRIATGVAVVTIGLMAAVMPAVKPASAAPDLPAMVPSAQTFSVGYGTITTSVIATANDIAGSVYMLGTTNASTELLVFGKDASGADVSLAGASGMTFVVKYDAAGVVQWATRMASDVSNQATTGIALSGGTTPKVYVTGWLTANRMFGNNGAQVAIAALTSGSDSNPFVVQLDGADGTIGMYGGFGTDGLSLKPSNIAVSGDGASVYLVGSGTGTAGGINFETGGTSGAFLARIDASNPASPSRTALVPFSGDAGAIVTLTSATVAASGDVFAVGAVTGGNLTTPTAVTLSAPAGLLVGYDSTLATSKVVKTISPATAFASLLLSAVASQGTDIYYTGVWRGGDLVLPTTAGGDVTLSPTGTDSYGFLAKASITDITAQPANAGNVTWAVPIGGTGLNVVSTDTGSFLPTIQPAPVAVDASGNVSIAMMTNGAADATSPPVARVGTTRNILVARLTTAGEFTSGVAMGADAGFVLGNTSGVASSGLFTLGGKMTADFTVPEISRGADPGVGMVLRAAPTYAVTAAKDGTGTGKVTSSAGGIDCGTTCTSTALGAGTSVTLTATADAGSTFTAWAGACSGTATTATFSLSSNATCTATFTLDGAPAPTPTVPPAPPPSFVTAPPSTVENAATVGSGTGSVSFASNFADPSALTFTAAPLAGGSLPSWISFDPASVTFSYTVPLPPDLPIQPVADGRAVRADARANWSNTVYPLALRVAQIPVVLTATDKVTGVSYASTIQMSFYAPRNPVAISALSMSLDRALGDRSSGRSALSYDGGQMIFETASTNLFPAASSPYGDIVRYHGLTGMRDRLSQTAIPGGGVANPADGLSSSPAVSADGAYGAFASDAPAVSVTPAGGRRQVYRVALGYPRVPLNQTVTPAPEMVSTTAAGIAANGSSDNPSVSQNGRYVAFDSTATNLRAGLDGSRQVWRKDFATGEVTWVSAGANPSLSWDGEVVAYENASRIEVKNLVTGAVRAVGAGSAPRLSARGDRVAFVTAAAGRALVVQVDLATGATREIGAGDQPAMSADGRFVAWRAMGDNGFTQIWLRDVDRGVTALVTQTAVGTGGNGDSLHPSVSGDGSQIGFVSAASDLVNGSPKGTQAYVAANPLPLPEKTGYWYQPVSSGGQGWLLQRWGNRAYVGGLAYDADGQPAWYAGLCNLSGLACSGTLSRLADGAPFGSAAGPAPQATPAAAFTLTTSEDGRTTSLQVGGTAQSLSPFPISGTATTGFAGLPQAGWWYEPAATGGNGYFLAVNTQPQADGSVKQMAYVSVLTFDGTGRPAWYSSLAALDAELSFSGTLMQYTGGPQLGQSQGGTTGATSVGQLRIVFTGSDKARISLPNGRVAEIVPYRF